MKSDELESGKGREQFGLVLFLLGALPLVLVVMAFLRPPEPGVETSGLAAVASAIVRAFGYLPAVVVALSLAVVGVWMFLGNPLREPGRHLLAGAGLAVAIAVALGALGFDGGNLGERTGGFLAHSLGSWAGLVVAAAVGAAVVGFSWLGWTLPSAEKVPASATLSDALTEKEEDGVSVAEARALVPDESTLEYMEELWRHAQGEAPQVVPLPPSPYPEDVRLRGEVPDGAIPLSGSKDEAKPDSVPAEGVAQRWNRTAAERQADDRAGADMAAAAELVQPGAPRPTPASIQPVSKKSSESDDPFREVEDGELTSLRILEEAPEEPAPAPWRVLPKGVQPLVPEGVVDILDDVDARPRPTWEGQADSGADEDLVAEAEEEDPEAFEEEDEEYEEEDEELVAEDEEEDPEASEEEDEEYEEEDEELVAEDEEEDPEASEEEDEEYEEEDEELVAEDEEEDPEASEEEDEEYEEEDEELVAEDEEEDPEASEEEDEEYEEEDEELVAEDEEEDPEASEEEDEEYEEEDEELVAEDEEEDPEASEEEDEEYEEEDEELVAEDEEEDPEASEEEDEEYEEEDEELVAEDEEEDPEASEEEDEEYEEEDEELVAEDESGEAPLILEPQPAPSAGLIPTGPALVRAAGLLFLEEGRVAVSLLQRQFGLDFEEACSLLDNLHEAGLIGPYEGGQQRALLLDRSQWESIAG